MNEGSDIPALVASSYETVRRFYEAHQRELGNTGFRILYGPALPNPDVLFVGYQPGGSRPEPGQHDGPPPQCDYRVASWPLALIVDKNWPVDRYPNVTGLNVVFFRAPSMRIWHRVSRPVRRAAEEMSTEIAQRLIMAMTPKLVVAIGLATFDQISVAVSSVRSETGRVLIKRGTIGGAPIIGLLHLTGARISNVDRAIIAREIA